MFVKSETGDILYNSATGVYLSKNKLYLSRDPNFLFNDIVYKILGYHTAIIIIKTEYLLIKIYDNDIYYRIIPVSGFFVNKLFDKIEDINKNDILGCFLSLGSIKYIFTNNYIYNAHNNKIIYKYDNYIKSNDYFLLHGNKCIFIGVDDILNLHEGNILKYISSGLYSVENINDIIYNYVITLDSVYKQLYIGILYTNKSEYYDLPYNYKNRIFNKKIKNIKSARKV